MKTLMSFISIITFLTISSYGQTKDVNALLAKPESRMEIFNAIMNSHNYMTEFMQAMHGNEHAMMMMRGDNQMMKGGGGQMGMHGSNQMTDRNGMMNMMHQNPGMMKMMMGNMMDVVATDSTMSSEMVNMMANHPQMMHMMMNNSNNNIKKGPVNGNKMIPPKDKKENMGQIHQH